MRPIRTVPPKDEREYPLVITAEEKDKVLNYILVVPPFNTERNII